MKTFKIASLCVSFILVLSIAGCSNEQKNDTASKVTVAETISESSKPAAESQDSSADNIVLNDILIISRDYCHGWNDFDTGMFITADGRVYDFDATGRSEGEHSRFLTYEQLYEHLLERMKTVEPVTTADVTSIISDIQELELSENEWTSEYTANDIGRHDYELVRKVNGKLVFDTLYSTGDSLEGYTENDKAMDIVDACSDIFKNTGTESKE